jgi:hypothetical protein
MKYTMKREFRSHVATALLLASGILFAVPARAVITLYPKAVTNGLTLTALINQGWTVLYNVTYATVTTTSDVNGWRTAAGADYIFMGGTDAAGNVLLGASGLASEVLAPTASTSIAHPASSSALYWYSVSGSSIGFSPNSSILLIPADYGGTVPDYRLSWHLTGADGGWRLGALEGLNADTTHRKIVLAAPANVPTLGVGKAVYLRFTNLWIGSQYQIQASPDMVTWTNTGTAFTATNATQASTGYWVTDNVGQLFFRVVKQ